MTQRLFPEPDNGTAAADSADCAASACPTASPATPGRRRFIEISGAAVAAGTLGLSTPAAARMAEVHWRGVVLGARATLRLVHPNRPRAQHILAAALAEIERLEQIFSIYRPTSALSRLNRDGELVSPPADLLRLLSLTQRISRVSGDAFDPTIQPLWRLYADHQVGRPAGRRGGPARAAIARVRALVNWRNMAIAPDRIAFLKPDMAVTLNGIAQGYIGDQVSALLKRMGLRHALVNLGEISALGRHPEGRGWAVGIAMPDDQKKTVHRLALSNAAVATSGQSGGDGQANPRFGHILDPRTGMPARLHQSVSVVASSAAVADGLSTAAFLLSDTQIITLAAPFQVNQIHRIDLAGAIRRLV